jgi:hypothetical protein
MKALWALLLLASTAAAGLPPSVERELPAFQAAEQRLEDATLALAAARREALGPQEAVAQARAQAGTWWGAWWLQRRLAQLKQRLDQVEAARQAQVEAHSAVFILLSGLEEELRASLEKELASPSPGLADAWRTQRDWSRRVEALERGLERNPGTAPEERRLLAEARLDQIRRDLRLVEALQRRRLISPAESAEARSTLALALDQWQGRKAKK